VDPSELEGQICEECGSPMRLRTGKNGSAFLGCTAYPKCRNVISVSIQGGKAEARPDEPTGEKCPVCGHDLVKRHGRFGEYVSCSNYPNCRYKPPKPVALTGVTCPECNQGQILERKGRFGPFYGCSRYPECTRNFRARPVPKPCPSCGTAFLLVRERKAGAFYACEAEGCGFDEPAGDLDSYPVTTEITEQARQAALAAAVAPVPKKRTPRRKAEAPPTDGDAPKTESRTGKNRAAGKRPARPASVKPPGRQSRKAAASARPKRRPAKK